jgi:hypothetical protein
MSKKPESVPFGLWILKFRQTGERWFKLAWQATIVDQCSKLKGFYGRIQPLLSQWLIFLVISLDI